MDTSAIDFFIDKYKAEIDDLRGKMSDVENSEDEFSSFQKIAESYYILSEQYKLRIKQIAEETLVAFQNEDITTIGRLLDEGWQQKRQTSSLISNTEIDDLYDHFKYHQAIGFKLLGSGGSGFILTISDHPKRLIKNTSLTPIPFDFDYDGSKIILS